MGATVVQEVCGRLGAKQNFLWYRSVPEKVTHCALCGFVVFHDLVNANVFVCANVLVLLGKSHATLGSNATCHSTPIISQPAEIIICTAMEIQAKS